MPLFHISVVNAEFESSDNEQLASIDTARERALRSALELGADEVATGKPFFGAEVTVGEEGRKAERFVIAIGVSPLR